MTVPVLMEEHSHKGATLRLYRCPDCAGAGTICADTWYPGFKNCPTCCGAGVVECCVQCGSTFDVETVDPENFDPQELYCDEAGRCWQCASERACAEIAAYPFTPEQLARADFDYQEEKDRQVEREAR